MVDPGNHHRKTEDGKASPVPKICLAGIDAPERKQAFGKRSKEYLSSLVAGESVQVDWSKRRCRGLDGALAHCAALPAAI